MPPCSRSCSGSPSSLEAAYPWKVVNALFWALTAIPIYLLARRLVSQWWAVLAAGLTARHPVVDLVSVR